jgi:hypothetical protein
MAAAVPAQAQALDLTVQPVQVAVVAVDLIQALEVRADQAVAEL